MSATAPAPVVARPEPLTNGQLPLGPFQHLDATQIGLLELEHGLTLREPWPRAQSDGPAYRDALVLVRHHGEPIAIVHLPRPLADWDAEELRATVEAQCGATRRADRASASVPALPAASVAIIVPTGGRTAQLARMLESMLAHLRELPEVIIVDNRPGTGDTEAVVASFTARNPAIRYVAEPRPGSSVARNRGIAETDAELVVFTDDDVVVDRDWLAWLLAPFADPAVGCVTGMVLPLALDAPAQKHFEQYAGFSKGLHRREYDLAGHRAGERLLYPYWGGVFGSGNSMAFRRPALVGAGGFDPALGAGSVALAGADIEAMSASILRGERLVYEPRSICWHEHRASDEALRRQLFNYGVGFTAILTKALVHDRRFLASVARSVPVAVALRRRRRAAGGESAGAALPAELAQLQRRGMLRGPGLYLKSLAWARRLRLGAVIAGR